MKFQSNGMTLKELKNYEHALEEVKYQCKCGHKVVIPKWVDKQICSWCKNYVFKDKKQEFEYRLRGKLKK